MSYTENITNSELDQMPQGEGSHYQLRPREAIKPPSRYASHDQMPTNTDKIKILKRKRIGKKGLITKKI